MTTLLPSTVVGYVTDTYTGAGIPSATITVWLRGNVFGVRCGAHNDKRGILTTDANGRYAFGATLESGDEVLLEFYARGHAEAARQFVLRPGENQCDVQLRSTSPEVGPAAKLRRQHLEPAQDGHQRLLGQLQVIRVTVERLTRQGQTTDGRPVLHHVSTARLVHDEIQDHLEALYDSPAYPLLTDADRFTIQDIQRKTRAAQKDLAHFLQALGALGVEGPPLTN